LYFSYKQIENIKGKKIKNNEKSIQPLIRAVEMKEGIFKHFLKKRTSLCLNFTKCLVSMDLRKENPNF